MAFINNQEIKIFITFFFIYSFFIYWVGWNEQSRFVLTRAIVDEGRFEIDSYYNQTSDRAYYNGHYYSDKDPGTSFLAIPVYAAWKFFYYNFLSQDFIEKHSGSNEYIITLIGDDISIIDYINPDLFILSSMVLVTIFTSSLFSALLLVLIYKISGYFTKNEKQRLLLVFTSGLGTLIFPYALVFLEHASASFFIFLSFYLLFKTKQEKIKDNKYFLLAGLSSGFGITCSAVTSIVALACFLYLLHYKKRKIYYFLVGCFIGVLPFLLYNYVVFETPFTLPRHHLDQTIWSKLGGIYGLQEPNSFVALRLMFYPYKGLFFYYPVLILSFVGLYYMYKKFKIESILILFVFSAFLIMNSSWWAWWGGTSFGPRHLMPTMPFFALPLIFVFMNFNRSKIFKCVVFLLILYSIFVNFVGLQPMYEEIVDIKTIDVASEYKEKINTFQVMINPLYEYYMPLFLKDGPRSRISENLINSEPIDIRFLLPDQREFFSSLYFHIPFLSLLPIMLFTFFIWYKEIFTKRRKAFFLKHKWAILILFVLISFTVLLLHLMPSERFILGKGWYLQSPGEEGRWMKQDGEIILNNPTDSTKLIKFTTILGSYYRNREIQVHLNNKLVDTAVIFSDHALEYTWPLKLEPGKNIVKLHVTRCDIPNIVEAKDDMRCLGIQLLNLTLEELKENYVFNKYWYQQSPIEEGRWMRQNGTIIIYNKEKVPIKLKLTGSSFYKHRSIKIYVNNELMTTNIFSATNVTNVEIPIIDGLEDITVKFYSTGGCDRPIEFGYGNDTRCISINLYNINLQQVR